MWEISFCKEPQSSQSLRRMTRVVVTCGPSYEPIDEVRRLTNFSTGELGILLANALSSAGYDVLCFKGVGATCGVSGWRGQTCSVAARVCPSVAGLLAQPAAEVAARAGILALDMTLVPAMHGGVQDGFLRGSFARRHGLDGARHDQPENRRARIRERGGGISSLMSPS